MIKVSLKYNMIKVSSNYDQSISIPLPGSGIHTAQHISRRQMPTVLKRNKRYLCDYPCRHCPIYVSPIDWHTRSSTQLNAAQRSSTQLNAAQRSSTQLNPAQPSSTQLNPAQPSSTQLNPAQPSSTPLNTPRHKQPARACTPPRRPPATPAPAAAASGSARAPRSPCTEPSSDPLA
jgi:hypothetical protein